MICSKTVVAMLEEAVSGKITDFWDFSFEFNALFGENEKFAEDWYKENPEMFELLNTAEILYFLEEHDTNDYKGFIEFLAPYYIKVKNMVN